MRIELNIANTENLMGMSKQDLNEITEILEALVASGGLTGVRGGQTIIHFDADGIFQKVELKYFPWVRRSKKIDTPHTSRYN